MFGLVALQIVSLPVFVTTGLGFTVTVMVYGALPQTPVVDVGVTMYSTLPALTLLGLDNTWLIVFPVPGAAPVILPVMVPMVHEKLLGAVDVSVMFVFVPLHIDAADGFVMAGVGLTVTV